MREILQAYPYLMLSLALLILAGLALWMRPEHRRGMMWSGVLSAPCALYAVLFVPQYWQPRQVFRFMAGPEDLIFSFANGVVVWAMVADGSLRIRTKPRWAQTTVRGGFLTGVFLLQWAAFLELGLRLMDAACSSAAAGSGTQTDGTAGFEAAGVHAVTAQMQELVTEDMGRITLIALVL